MQETETRSLAPPLSWQRTVSPEVVQLSMNLLRLSKPNRSLVVGVFTGLGLIGVASMTDVRGLVVALEHPEFAHYWKQVGLEYALRVSLPSILHPCCWNTGPPGAGDEESSVSAMPASSSTLCGQRLAV